MKITFDPQKDLENRRKHGVSLAQASNIDWLSLWERSDTSFSYGEDRFKGIAYLGSVLHYVVYTDRGDSRRIISLRKATKYEVDLYASS